MTPPSSVARPAAATTTKPNPIFVFVFAHPDDESMFFLPTIRSLVDVGETVWFLCLTTGDYNGLGKTREKEMEKAGRLLGASKVIVRNDGETDTGIVDHPTKRYSKTIVAAAIRDSLSNCCNEENNRFVLVTFDELGISGHVNHIDTYLGVCHLMEEQEQTVSGSNTTTRIRSDEPLISETWYLKSERNSLVKYVPVLSWMLLVVSLLVPRLTCTSEVSESPSDDKKFTSRVFRMHNPKLNWNAMATHHSQFVWYRRLFVVFSCYTYYNKLICKQSSAS